jgi:hypothetical protein
MVTLNSYVTNYQRVQELFQCPFSFDSPGWIRVQRLPWWKQVFWGYPKGLKQRNIGNWLVVWNMNSMTFHSVISSSQLTSCHIFQRGRSTTNQGNDHFFGYQTWIKTISRWMGEPKSWHLKRFFSFQHRGSFSVWNRGFIPKAPKKYGNV